MKPPAHSCRTLTAALAAAVVLTAAAAAATPVRAADDAPLPRLDLKAVETMIRGTGADPLLITVMAAWCHPCVDELPMLNRLYNRYRDRGLRVVGLAIDYNGPGAMATIIRRLKIDFPVFWSGESLVSAYSLTAIPVMFVVVDGRITERLEGKRHRRSLERRIRKLLSEDP